MSNPTSGVLAAWKATAPPRPACIAPPAGARQRLAAALRPGAQPRPSTAPRRQRVVTCRTAQRAGLEAAELNAACNAALQVMLANDRRRVPEVEQQLQALRLQALQEGRDAQAAQLLKVVEGMLQHTVLKEADELAGPYAAALNRIVNQVAGSDWKLALEGQSAEAAAAAQEPKFSTWEDVLGGKKKAGSSSGRNEGGGSGSSSSGGAAGRAGQPADATYYELLGVAPDADGKNIKAAYRKLALQLHPDVNSAPDAAQRFAEVAAAYDVLSDPEARALYDRYGPEGMKGRAGAASGSGNARRAWDEFKPFKKQNKRTHARDASTASYGSSMGSMDEGPDPDSSAAGAAAQSTASPGSAPAAGTSSSTAESEQHQQQQPSSSSSGGSGNGFGEQYAGMPRAGAVVEYPLSQQVQAELQDGRTHGVGLLVGRNLDRGDARRLPPEALDLCEIEPLRQEETGSSRWVPDELSPSAFCRLGELRPVAVDCFDQRFDVWTITAQLSEGCGGPDLGEEVIL